MTVWVKVAFIGLVVCSFGWLSSRAAIAQSSKPRQMRAVTSDDGPRQPSMRPQTPYRVDRAIRGTTEPHTPASRATLTFDPACVPGRRAVIAAVGDMLFHDALQAQALQPGHSFRAFWAPVASVLAAADLTYGNLESPIARGVGPGGRALPDPGRVLDRVVYGRRGNELVFNTHPAVAADLVAAGFDVVSTANNHSADRGVLGIDRTLDALETARLAATGTRRSTDTSSPWSTRTTTANGLTVAWLACTFNLNGMPDPRRQVLQCFRDLDAVQDEIKNLAADPSVDAVIFTPHWGVEGAPLPQATDRGLARLAIDAGATAVIGTHPHVIQPWEKHVTPHGREGLIIYSTGNFISNQKSDDQRTGLIALLEVTKPETAPARLSAVGYVPTYVQMQGDYGHRVTELGSPSAVLRRLPPGNRVSAATFRALPRGCAPDGLPATPSLVVAQRTPASAFDNANLHPTVPRLPLDVAMAASGLHLMLLAAPRHDEVRPSSHVSDAPSLRECASAGFSARRGDGVAARTSCIDDRRVRPSDRRHETSGPTAQVLGPAMLRLVATSLSVGARMPHLVAAHDVPPPPAPPPHRQDPLHPGRLRLDVLLADAVRRDAAIDMDLPDRKRSVTPPAIRSVEDA